MQTSNYSAVSANLWGILLIMATSMVGAQAVPAQQMQHLNMASATAVGEAADIVRDPTDVPATVGNRVPAVVHVSLTAQELVGTLDAAAGTTYRYWTFNGKVPGPMIRVLQGDKVEVTLHNDPNSHMAHSIDLHAALGPGGGAAMSQTMPGQAKTFTFQASTPGLFVYHCGTPMIGDHIANGMYGLILVEPAGGLAKVDREFYVMQGEVYTSSPKGKAGLQQFSPAKLMQEKADYFVFNGAVDALTTLHALHAKVGQKVRIFFGDAGPNATSSLHMVGQIFTKDYSLGSFSDPLTGVQTASVPPGGAAMLELTTTTGGKFPIMDHAMARMPKGLMAALVVDGEENAELMHAGPAEDSAPESARVTGMTPADLTDAFNTPTAPARSVPATGRDMSVADMPGMAMARRNAAERAVISANANAIATTPNQHTLNGCLMLQFDGKAMLKALNSSKMYRLEGRPLRFSENANRIVQVAGHSGSIMAVEDPNIPSFVVDTVDQLAPNCSAKITPADIRKALAKNTATGPAGTVRMGDMAFFPSTITVTVGDKVTWANTSQVFHNVVDDASQALSPVDVSLPTGGRPFASPMMQPGQAYSRVFSTPGVYHYVCTLHEGNGMKGIVIVKPAAVLAANK